MQRFAVATGLSLLIAAAPARAERKSEPPSQRSVCLIVESASRAHGLPVDFFARVIWQESRFDADAVGPRTRSGEHALGIAQFMPGTAVERGLLDPFNPVQALTKAAEFLQELRVQFGNLGLAAAAYNAGPRRVREWLHGGGYMPSQTRHYVFVITGHTVDEWRNAKDTAKASPPTDCRNVMAMLERNPNPFLAALEQRVRQGISQPQLQGSSEKCRLKTRARRMLSRTCTHNGSRLGCLFLAAALSCASDTVAAQQLHGQVGVKPSGHQHISKPHRDVSRPHIPRVRPAIETHHFRGDTYRGRSAWHRGRWHHATRNGHVGWWWDVGGIWYFYPERSEEPPAYVSDVQVEDAEPSAAPEPPQEPNQPEPPHRAFYYRPGELKGVPYDTLEECMAVRNKAGNGVCVM